MKSCFNFFGQLFESYFMPCAIVSNHCHNLLCIEICHTGKTKFLFRGCGWSNKAVSQSSEDKLWITAISQPLDSMYGKDQLEYKFILGKGTIVQENDDPILLFQFDHDKTNYESTIRSIDVDSFKLAKSLRPQLDDCLHQDVDELAISPMEPVVHFRDAPVISMPTVIRPVSAAQCRSDRSNLKFDKKAIFWHQYPQVSVNIFHPSNITSIYGSFCETDLVTLSEKPQKGY